MSWQKGTCRYRDKRAPLSLYLHVPFCHDICYYCACNKIVTRKKNVAQQYLGRLQREITMQSELAGKHRPSASG